MWLNYHAYGHPLTSSADLLLLDAAMMAAVLSLRRPRAARAVVVVAGMVTVERVTPVMVGTARATVLLTLLFSSCASLLCLVAARTAAVLSFRSPRAPRVVARSAVTTTVGTAMATVPETVATQARRAEARRMGFMMSERSYWSAQTTH